MIYSRKVMFGTAVAEFMRPAVIMRQEVPAMNEEEARMFADIMVDIYFGEMARGVFYWPTTWTQNER